MTRLVMIKLCALPLQIARRDAATPFASTTHPYVGFGRAPDHVLVEVRPCVKPCCPFVFIHTSWTNLDQILTCNVSMCSWILTLFTDCRVLPHGCALHFLDLFFRSGWKAFYKVTLLIFTEAKVRWITMYVCSMSVAMMLMLIARLKPYVLPGWHYEQAECGRRDHSAGGCSADISCQRRNLYRALRVRSDADTELCCMGTCTVYL